MKTVKQYEASVRGALKLTNRYSKALEIQIHALASALRTLDIATGEIDNLDSVTIIEAKGREVAHPAFKIQRDAQDSVTRQMKALGLTAEALEGENEKDPLADITKEAIEASKNPIIIKPDADENE